MDDLLEAAVRDAQAEGAIAVSEDAEQLAFELDAYLLLANAQFVISPTRPPSTGRATRSSAGCRGDSVRLRQAASARLTRRSAARASRA